MTADPTEARAPNTIAGILSRIRDKDAREIKRAAMMPHKIALGEEDADSDKKAHKSWFRGEHTHFNPHMKDMVQESSVKEHVLKGWLPEAPVITSKTQITAFGSCFAANISKWLSHRNYRVLTKDDAAKNAYVIACGEGMVNSFVIRQQFEWAWEDRQFDQDLWHGYDAETYGYDDDIKRQTKQIFDQTDVFILTFGLSEVWYDEPTGNVFWRSIPKEAYDPSRHKFRVSSVEENRDNLRAIYQLIRKHRPDAKIIFTLSPIPLIATFRDNSCLTSNSVSKSVLRVAIDEVLREFKDQGHLFYWPSYELITDVFKLPYIPDRRHIPHPVLDFIMTQFEHVWCKAEDNPPPNLKDAWVLACARAGLLPPRLEQMVKKRSIGGVRHMMANHSFSNDTDVDREVRALLESLVLSWQAQAKSAAA